MNNQILSNLYFRQSMINDYLTCPQMFLYRWILNVEQETSWFAAFLGSAGHHVISNIHKEHKFDYDFMDILGQFESAFNEIVEEADEDPRISTNFNSVQEQLEAESTQYTNLILEYQKDERNFNFHSVINEQSFVLPIQINGEDTLFTGTVDQAGYYNDGTFALRDLKFRDSAFKPSKVELDINIQLTVYANALKYGNPSCLHCKPEISQNGKLQYSGPCSSCIRKIGTKYWPRKYPYRCELIWMKDYEKYKKDQYIHKIKDPKKIKEYNPATGRNVIRTIVNPKWEEGYKKGDRKGRVFLSTVRTPEHIEVLMKDVEGVIKAMRNGIFYRKPGSHCASWCQYKDTCVDAKNIEVNELKELKDYPYE